MFSFLRRKNSNFNSSAAVEEILEKMGSVFYDFGLVGPKRSLFAGHYQLPLSPGGDVLSVGPWLKVPIDLVRLPKGVFLEDLRDERLLTALRAATGRNVEFRETESAPVQLSLITESTKKKKFDDPFIPGEFWFFIELDRNTLHGIPRNVDFSRLPVPVDFRTLPIPFGISQADTFEWFDMSHLVGLLVAGSTRQGKSVWLRQVLRYLSANFPPEYFRAALLDLKFGVEFGRFEGDPHFDIFTSPSDVLGFVSAETARRFQLFKAAGRFSILDYNDSVCDPLPYWLIVVDEYAAFARLCNRDEVKQAELMVAQSAGAGLYWVIATQRPSVDIVTGSLKANLGSRMSFSLASTVDAGVVFDRDDFEEVVRIGCPGRAWALVGDRVLEFQSSFIE